MTKRFDDLFLATLGMFKMNNSEAEKLRPKAIAEVFEKVLETRERCEKTFKEKPSIYEERGVKSV
jgi:hypothetical protein